MNASAAPAEPAAVFAALGDQTRLWLIGELADGRARSISSLVVGARMSRQAVTKHLRVLEEAGLVASGREGREARFRLERQALQEARAYLDTVSSQWDAAIERLSAHLEKDG